MINFIENLIHAFIKLHAHILTIIFASVLIDIIQGLAFKTTLRSLSKAIPLNLKLELHLTTFYQFNSTDQ